MPSVIILADTSLRCRVRLLVKVAVLPVPLVKLSYVLTIMSMEVVNERHWTSWYSEIHVFTCAKSDDHANRTRAPHIQLPMRKTRKSRLGIVIR